jgi:hypothetical protein
VTPGWLLNVVAAIMLVVAAASMIRLLAVTLAATWPSGALSSGALSSDALPSGALPFRALLSRALLSRALRAGADADIAQVLMGIAMAGMFTTSLATLPSSVWAVAFGLMTAWFAIRSWLAAGGVRAVIAHRCTLHVVHCAAMLYIFLALVTTSGGAGMAGMNMSGAAMQTLRYPTLAGAFLVLIIAYCAWDLDQLSGGRYRALSVAGPGGSAGQAAMVAPSGKSAARLLLLAPEAKVSWEVVLGVAMAFMLVIMI